MFDAFWCWGVQGSEFRVQGGFVLEVLSLQVLSLGFKMSWLAVLGFRGLVFRLGFSGLEFNTFRITNFGRVTASGFRFRSVLETHGSGQQKAQEFRNL